MEIITIGAAKKLMCPFVQISVQQKDGIMHTGNIDCKHNGCIAWQPHKRYKYKTINGKNKQMQEIAKRDGWEWHDGEEWRKPLPEDEQTGQCLLVRGK